MTIKVEESGQNWAIVSMRYILDDDDFALNAYARLLFWGNKCICLAESVTTSPSETFVVDSACVAVYEDGLCKGCAKKLFSFVSEHIGENVNSTKDLEELVKENMVEYLKTFSFSEYNYYYEKYGFEFDMG